MEGRGGGCDQTSTTEPRQAFRYPERDAPYRGDVLARSSPKAQEKQPRRRAIDRRSQTGMLCPNGAANSQERELRGGTSSVALAVPERAAVLAAVGPEAGP